MAAQTRPRSLAQATMGSDVIVRFYESRLWRRNPLLALLMGLTFDQGYALIAHAARPTESDVILDLVCGPATYARKGNPCEQSTTPKEKRGEKARVNRNQRRKEDWTD
jgi:hypothetical protein